MESLLADVRNRIDALDTQIVELIAERQRWVVRAGELKRGQPIDTVDAPDRVAAVIDRVRELAAQSGASPDVVERAYRGLIDGFIQLERHVHADQGTSTDA